MNIWVDADACPNVIKDILFRAAQRTGLPLTLIANHVLKVPPAENIRFIQVPHGFDVADSEIVDRVVQGDIVISADIPLASEVISKGALCLSPRGELLNKGNIAARLSMRDFMETMRSSGEDIGGPKAISQRDRQAFANQLDKLLSAKRG